MEKNSIAQNKEHDFSLLVYQYPDWCSSIEDVKNKCSQIIDSPDASAQTARLGARDREEVDYESLSISQQRAHDLVLRACSLGFGHSKTDGGLDVSRLIIIGGGAGAGKSRVTNIITTSLQKKT